MAPCALMRAIQDHYNEADSRKWPGRAGEVGRAARRPAKDMLDEFMLTTRDFFNVLAQYELEHPDFRALGAVPANFCDLVYTREVCKLTLRQLLAAGKRRCAVVFNTDPGHLPGQHWIMLWVDLTAPAGFAEIAYFDSEAQSPPANVRHLMDRLHAEAGRLHRKGKIPAPPRPEGALVAVSKRHQRGGRECGIYCVYFVERLLGGAPVEQLRGTPRISNADMRDFMRTELFPRATKAMA